MTSILVQHNHFILISDVEYSSVLGQHTNLSQSIFGQVIRDQRWEGGGELSTEEFQFPDEKRSEMSGTIRFCSARQAGGGYAGTNYGTSGSNVMNVNTISHILFWSNSTQAE